MRKERILLVDDEEFTLEACKLSLEREQFEVMTAASGSRALKMLKNKEMDMLITDINLPGMSGVELLNEAKSLYPDMATAIISGHGTLDLAMETMLLGASAFLLKPFTASELKSAVRKIIQKDSIHKATLDVQMIEDLTSLTEKMAEKIEPGDFARLIVSHAFEDLRGTYASLIIKEGEKLKFIEKKAASTKIVQSLRPLNPMAMKMIKAGKKVVFRDAGKGFARLHSDVGDLDVVISVSVPIVLEGKVVGLLSVGRAEDLSEFNRGDIEYLELLANNFAIAMERLNLNKNLGHALTLKRKNMGNKDSFISSINHEFRTPLNAVLGFSELLLEKMKDESDDSLFKREISLIYNKGEELLRLFEGIIDASLLGKGDLIITKEKVNASEILREIGGDYKQQAQDKGLSLQMELPEEEIPLDSDPKLLKSVLAKLVENALKFSNEGEINISLISDGTEVIFGIGDNGAGIKKEKMGIIFDKFRQVDESITRKHEGIGLGLYLANHISKKLGGLIEAESPWIKGSAGSRQKGSLFTLRLPSP